MELESAANALKQLGHPSRLAIYRAVIKAGQRGIPVGKIQEQLGIPNSTLSHHISSLGSANLIIQQRDGRTLYCIARYDVFNGVLGYLQDECCADE